MTAREIFYDWGGANIWLFRHIHAHSPGPMDSLMAWISSAGHYWNFPVVVIVWLIVAERMKRSGHVLAPLVAVQFKRLLIAAAIALLLTAIPKLLLDIPRPSESFASTDVRAALSKFDWHGGFPSGHAVFVSLLAATLWPLLTPRYRGVAVMLVLAVGISRVWLGLHFPVDVAAGYFIGTACALLAVCVTRGFLPSAGGTSFSHKPQITEDLPQR